MRHRKPVRSCARLVAVTISGIVFTDSSSFGQIASAVIRQGDALDGTTVSNVDAPSSNGIQGYSYGTTNGDALSRFYGNATGGPLALLRKEATFGTFQQTAFEGFHGLADSGSIGYSPTVSDGAFTGLDCAWLDSTKVLNERDPMPTIPGQFSTFNSDVMITYTGTPYWVGGYAPTAGGTTANRALFSGAGATRVIGGGDLIPAAGVAISTAGGPGFGVRMSATGTNYIMSPDLDGATTTDTGIVVNGNMISAGGNLVREGTAVPASVGGIGDNWANFDAMAINDANEPFFTGDTSAATTTDEFVFVKDQIVLREGAAVGTPLGAGVISGDIEWGDANEKNDWAVTWDATVGGTNLEALIVNGGCVLIEGQLVDWNGDGTIDASDNNGKLADFTSIRALTVGERQFDSFFDVFFTADIDFLGTPSATDDLEGGFRFRYIIPEPGTASLLGVGALLAMCRRSRR